jgi:hypothetical protein
MGPTGRGKEARSKEGAIKIGCILAVCKLFFFRFDPKEELG